MKYIYSRFLMIASSVSSAWAVPYDLEARKKGRSFERPFLFPLVDHEHPVVLPQVSHFIHVPFRTSVKFEHSPHMSPS